MIKASDSWITAQQYLTGGVSSSFRINPYTAQPRYLSRADGPYIYDLDGRQYVDFFMGHGACPLGHNRPEIRQAIQEALELGYFAEFDAPLTIELAKKKQHIPCAERVRYVNSGSEGTLMAMRLARGYTGRQGQDARLYKTAINACHTPLIRISLETIRETFAQSPGYCEKHGLAFGLEHNCQ